MGQEHTSNCYSILSFSLTYMMELYLKIHRTPESAAVTTEPDQSGSLVFAFI